MKKAFEKRLSALADQRKSASVDTLAGGRKGVEKESLRVDPSGELSKRGHPSGLGSALTNAYVTTDFSEALLEFVTPAYPHTWETLRTLCDIHQFVYGKLDDELLWAASMPCRLPDGDDIPLARYGDSNIGRMKTVYRRGLGFRYGRPMQTIAGVHFNYSLPDGFWPAYREVIGAAGDEESFRSAQYMGLVRNFRRFGWLLLYLFGASPALCKSFGASRQTEMPSFSDDTWYEPYGTSLRMSDLGYNNQNQARIRISLNSVDEYIRDLSAAIRSPEPDYEKIGVRVDGRYRQLNANLLQIENEYYSPVRPKRTIRSGERPTAALGRGGVEYVEIRSLDISIFDPCGISQNAMRFIEAFLIYCLLSPSPPLDEDSEAECASNQLDTARRGRDPKLELRRDGKPVPLADWAREIIEGVAAVAGHIDHEDGDESYRAAVARMRELVDDADATPSARLLKDLMDTKSGFFDYALSISRGHRDYFRGIAPPPDNRLERFEQEALDSLRRQQEIEASDEIGFDEFLARYFEKT